MPARVWSLLSYHLAGIPIVARKELKGCRNGITDGREVWVSPAILHVTFDDKKGDGLEIADQIAVIEVDSFKTGLKEAF